MIMIMIYEVALLIMIISNDLRSSFANNHNDNDSLIYLFDLKHQRHKPIIHSSYTDPRSGNFVDSCSGNFVDPSNNISADINEDLQSWLNDDNTITKATLPENFRCIISGPSECGKTFLLKKLILARIYFDKLYILALLVINI